ncbi:MAG: bifunctional UDP-N-acetylglucosamine diphosphorylase/glucosamine-1-phosphate N-acetyltransferase GlmU [Bryobacteraceae bacterium]
METNLSIVILAAGLGTRMKSRKAKVLHHAGGLSLVEHVVNSALTLTSPERVVVVVGHQAEEVKQTLAGSQVRFALQAEQRGTGDALSVCRGVTPDEDGLLVVLYGDCPLLSIDTLHTLIRHHANSQAAATVITTMLDDPTGYGRAIVNSAGCVEAIVEQKVATAEQRAVRQINSGIYCFNAALLWKHLGEIEPNPVSKEYYLTDIVEILNRAGHKVSALLHADPSELMGINTRVELAIVDGIFRERKVRQLMLDGVTIEKPETVVVDIPAGAGMDSVIEPFAQLLGNTRIGENCRIGSGSILRNSQLGDGVKIAPYTVIEDSRIEDGATIGPFARLRPGNHVLAAAHVGNFVELKKTTLGTGSKAGHLAYLGDSVIGAGVNIGAGTIVCNYDGKHKHQTKIGDKVFVGSNSTLVSPVELSAGSYVAAGSVVTANVPEDALALGRSRQVNKEGWAKKQRR